MGRQVRRTGCQGPVEDELVLFSPRRPVYSEWMIFKNGSRVTEAGVVRWTNPSVIRFAGDEDPIAKIEAHVQEIVLRAKDAGWKGPPFNPIALASLLNIPVDPTSAVSDARTVAGDQGPRIQYNPQQTRERARFSIAHEIAHTFFSDVLETTRHRGGDPNITDDWQLEMLCNIAAAEMVMPVGSLPSLNKLPPLEGLLSDRVQYDVSVEAFLIRVTKAADPPVSMFVASAKVRDGTARYSVDYVISSKSAPNLVARGRQIPDDSVVLHCTAIGATSHGTETWLSGEPALVECVGIPGYPGSSFPRVAGIVRHAEAVQTDLIHFVQGSIINPRPYPPLIICQLTNDKATRWGGGVAKQMASRYRRAEEEYGEWIKEVPRAKRLGEVHFSKIDQSTTLASLVAQEGYGASSVPLIRYSALDQALEQVAKYARTTNASVHLPRIGTGAAGAEWEIVESILRTQFVGIEKGVWVYDLPPLQVQQDLGF
jgi:Zn-dependent peptidase ImmA (M78 family)/O-acetyl-ADP-ribose deacetylase (regulator of RNase III)